MGSGGDGGRGFAAAAAIGARPPRGRGRPGGRRGRGREAASGVRRRERSGGKQRACAVDIHAARTTTVVTDSAASRTRNRPPHSAGRGNEPASSPSSDGDVRVTVATPGRPRRKEETSTAVARVGARQHEHQRLPPRRQRGQQGRRARGGQDCGPGADVGRVLPERPILFPQPQPFAVGERELGQPPPGRRVFAVQVLDGLPVDPGAGFEKVQIRGALRREREAVGHRGHGRGPRPEFGLPHAFARRQGARGAEGEAGVRGPPVRVRVDLRDRGQGLRRVRLQRLQRVPHVGLVGGRELGRGRDPRPVELGLHQRQERVLARAVEMAPLLHVARPPVVGRGFVEGVQGGKRDVVVVGEMSHHRREVFSKRPIL